MKRCISILLLLCLLAGLAACRDKDNTANRPLTLPELDAALLNGQLDDATAAELLALAFISAKQSQFTGDGADTAQYFAENAADQSYFDIKQRILRTRFDDVDPSTCEYETAVLSVSQEDAHITVMVDEYWSFHYIDMAAESGMRFSYTLGLVPQDGSWRVDTIFSDDEFDEQYYYNRSALSTAE